MRAALDDPVMAGFVERLEPLNALADSSPGFVWRLQDEEGDATAIRIFEDERILFNLSVWRSIEDLDAYTYKSAHVEAVRARSEWFERMVKPGLVLWWLAAGELTNNLKKFYAKYPVKYDFALFWIGIDGKY